MFNKRLEIREHSAAVYSLAFDGEYLYSASADRYVTRWDISSGTQDKFAIQFDHAVYSIAISNKLLFAGCNNGDLHVFDLEERKEIRFYQQHKAAIFSMLVNEGTGHLYIGDAEGNLSVWGLKDLSLRAFLTLDVGKIRDLALSPDASEIFLACANGFVVILDTNTLNEKNRWFAHNEACTSIYVGSDRVITGGKDAYLRDWKRNGEKKRAIPAHNFAIYRMLLLDNFLVTASRDKTIKVWDEHLNPITKLDAKTGGHSHSVNDIVQISSQSFASCGDDRRIIIWEKH